MLTAIEFAGAIAVMFAWVLCGPLLVTIALGLPAEVLGDRLARRRERRKGDRLAEPAGLHVSEEPAPLAATEGQRRG